MLRVPALDLPSSLPHPDAIKSWGASRESYEPEFWELEYQTYRYLGRVADAEIVTRHRCIVRNMEALTSPDRDIIPIQSFLSSWHWFRKEHQTRFESALRGSSFALPPINRPSPPVDGVGELLRSKHPNAGDVLFRYGQGKYLSPMLHSGTIRVGPASQYKEQQGNQARFDAELSKLSFMPGQYTRITTKDGKNISIKGDVSQSVSTSNYYLLCMSCGWDKSLFGDFGADSCLVIKDARTFADRLNVAVGRLWPGWYFHHNPVQYFDPYELRRNEYFEAVMSKDFRFAYQQEYRFLWFSKEGREATEFRYVNLGSLEDIAELHTVAEIYSDLHTRRNSSQTTSA